MNHDETCRQYTGAIRPEEEKQMILSVVILIIGFVLLVKGADFFVEGA